MSQQYARGRSSAVAIQELAEVATPSIESESGTVTPLETITASRVQSTSTEGRRSSRSAGQRSSDDQRSAWLTPRVGSAHTIPSVDLPNNLPSTQKAAINTMKLMMEEENLSSMQHRTLETIRSAVKVMNEVELTDTQLERTITLISIASQLTEESLQLGILPESIFDTFAEINSRAMSDLSHGEDDYQMIDTPYHAQQDFLRPLTQGTMGSHLTEKEVGLYVI